ncbi:hypothetical protein [Glycomyces buryatensis]|uniref:DUF948 domain-containing protein n=1 Tax=Glycomyces buryatensis TaxID=2570927 RepID=A0A4S8PUK0_9ACTN|nr:hypothetical protein [Glycomyces buryatensis]THV33392.1 hypothetical protein FAB82_24895 [Glycomyces buryatensis]
MIWAISGVLALAGLVFLAVAALRLRAGLSQLRNGLDRVNDRMEQAQELQERLNQTAAAAQKVTGSFPGK